MLFRSGDTLAALDTSGKLYFVTVGAGLSSPQSVGQPVSGFTYSAQQVLLSPGGQWAYVLEHDPATSNAYVQAVNEHAVELGGTNILGNPAAVGVGPQSETISGDGTQLYISFTDPQTPAQSGVAIIDITQTDCSQILDALCDCPNCDTGNCLVLATITGYVYASQVTTSQIDNH